MLVIWRFLAPVSGLVTMVGDDAEIRKLLAAANVSQDISDIARVGFVAITALSPDLNVAPARLSRFGFLWSGLGLGSESLTFRKLSSIVGGTTMLSVKRRA